MKIPSLVKQAQKFVDDNAPVILTAISIVGVGVTAVLTHKAAQETVYDIQQLSIEKQNGKYPLGAPSALDEIDAGRVTRAEIIQRTWKNYIPPVAAGIGTAGCMFMATKINLARLSTLGAVYALSDGNFKEYKAKVEEKLGAKESQKITDEINQDKVKNSPPPESILVVPDSGKQMCMEALTGRYFLSNIEEIKAAQNRLNYFLVQEGTASLSEFYEYLGLPKTSLSDNMGWAVGPDNKGMDLDFTSTLTEKGEPVLVMDYKNTPFLDYDS